MMELLEDVFIRGDRCGEVTEIHKQDFEIAGGSFEEAPHMGIIYSQEDFDPDDAFTAFTRVEQIIMDIAQNRELIYNISPREFEEVIERVLQDEGFETKLTQQTRDGGCDIIATKYEMGKPVVLYSILSVNATDARTLQG